MALTTHLLFSAAVLLSVLAAGAASGPSWCVPGLAIPHNPLEGCRTYVVSQTCGVGPYLPTRVMKERCCRELEEVAAYCRCEALRILMDGVIAPGGQLEGRLLRDRPGCPRQEQRAFAATLVAEPECNLPTIHGGPYCLSLGADGEYGGGEAQTMPSK